MLKFWVVFGDWDWHLASTGNFNSATQHSTHPLSAAVVEGIFIVSDTTAKRHGVEVFCRINGAQSILFVWQLVIVFPLIFVQLFKIFLQNFSFHFFSVLKFSNCLKSLEISVTEKKKQKIKINSWIKVSRCNRYRI